MSIKFLFKNLKNPPRDVGKIPPVVKFILTLIGILIQPIVNAFTYQFDTKSRFSFSNVKNAFIIGSTFFIYLGIKATYFFLVNFIYFWMNFLKRASVVLVDTVDDLKSFYTQLMNQKGSFYNIYSSLKKYINDYFRNNPHSFNENNSKTEGSNFKHPKKNNPTCLVFPKHKTTTNEHKKKSTTIHPSTHLSKNTQLKTA